VKSPDGAKIDLITFMEQVVGRRCADSNERLELCHAALTTLASTETHIALIVDDAHLLSDQSVRYLDLMASVARSSNVPLLIMLVGSPSLWDHLPKLGILAADNVARRFTLAEAVDRADDVVRNVKHPPRPAAVDEPDDHPVLETLEADEPFVVSPEMTDTTRVVALVRAARTDPVLIIQSPVRRRRLTLVSSVLLVAVTGGIAADLLLDGPLHASGLAAPLTIAEARHLLERVVWAGSHASRSVMAAATQAVVTVAPPVPADAPQVDAGVSVPVPTATAVAAAPAAADHGSASSEPATLAVSATADQGVPLPAAPVVAVVSPALPAATPPAAPIVTTAVVDAAPATVVSGPNDGLAGATASAPPVVAVSPAGPLVAAANEPVSPPVITPTAAVPVAIAAAVAPVSPAAFVPVTTAAASVAPAGDAARVTAPEFAPVSAAMPAHAAESAASSTVTTRVVTAGPRVSPELVAMLIARGDALLGTGDITAARLMYGRAASSDSAEGAIAMGMTFDPRVLSQAGIVGWQADPGRAVSWYRRAAALGSENGRRRLQQLGAISAQ
jgi:hypothetical protein